MILGFHYIITAYGFWLPNNPRGSWSRIIRQWELLPYGPAGKVDSRRSLAGQAHDDADRIAAKRLLKYPPVQFTGVQARAIARGIDQAAVEAGYCVYALAILPKHFHAVIARHDRDAGRIATHLKSRATFRLNQEGLNPMGRFPRKDGILPSPWARNHWVVFLDSTERMRQAIAYVENNPLKEGKRLQRWSMVRPFLERDESRR